MARNSLGLKTPFSVIIAVISSAGVTSNAGFQQLIPRTRIIVNENQVKESSFSNDNTYLIWISISNFTHLHAVKMNIFTNRLYLDYTRPLMGTPYITMDAIYKIMAKKIT